MSDMGRCARSQLQLHGIIVKCNVQQIASDEVIVVAFACFGSHPSRTMLPSSLSQMSRPSLLCPMGVVKPSAATRRSSYALRHTHGTSILVTERPWQGQVAMFARPDDKGAGIADKTLPTARTLYHALAKILRGVWSVTAFKAKDVTDADWEEEVLKSPVPVFVDFWAPWCGPCRMIGPTIDELIDELGDKFKAVSLTPAFASHSSHTMSIAYR